MVTGLELIPLFLDIGPTVFNLVMKLITKKGTRDIESKVNPILKEMHPLVEAMKRVEGTGTRAGPAGVAEELKQLMQTVEEGNQLMQKGKKHKELEEWMDSFRVSLSLAMFRVLLRMAVNVDEIKQQLLPNQSPQIHVHLHFSEGKSQSVYEEFIRYVNMCRRPEPSLLGDASTSTDKTKFANLLTQSVPQTSKVVAGIQISKAVNTPTKPSLRKVEAGSEISKAVNTPTKPALRKVVFEVLARDDYAKKLVEKAACNVNGVIYAERVVQDNQPKDLVIVMATEIFVEQDMIEYLKKKLHRKHVNVKEN